MSIKKELQENGASLNDFNMLSSTSEGTLSVLLPGILFFRLILVKAVTTYFRWNSSEINS